MRPASVMASIVTLSPGAALADAGISPDGLSPAEAARRLAEHGPNRIERLRRTPWPLRLLGEFFQFFSIILWIAAALAFIAELSSPGEGMARIGYSLVAVILISGLFSYWQEYRNEQTLAALAGLLPQEVKVVRANELVAIAAEQVVVGDIIVIEGGDSAPADCRLIEATDLRVNDAAITGESMPKVRTAAACEETPLLHARNVVLAGSSIVSGVGHGLVFATGAKSEFGRIARLTQTSTAGI